MAKSDVEEYNIPKCFRDHSLKWNGWGYVDSFFTFTPNQIVVMTSKRYEDLNGKIIPQVRPYIEKNLGVDLNHKTAAVPFSQLKISQPIINLAFANFLRYNEISFTNAARQRLARSHGQTLHEILALRSGDLTAVGHIPDYVAWPRSTNDVEKIVTAANDFDVVCVPIGGGTCVSSALICPSTEHRVVCSVDMTQMNAVHWVDEINFICQAQAGILGQDLEKHLNARGFTCGHEPDSVEFSSLGGWISTRASGMKKNKYGNIEDLLVHVDLVTSKGTLRKKCQVPRISSGPDLHQVVLGSEGTYGIITEAVIKIFPIPKCRRYGSIVFPSFKNGVDFLREVAKQNCQCASLRLVDNEQFKMGQAMKVQSESVLQDFSSYLAKLYVTRWKNFSMDEMVAATCVFEGTEKEVKESSKHLYDLAKRFEGVAAGEENGRYGYRLTFAIAYLRDLIMDYSVVGESFETSIAWDKVKVLCHNVKELLKHESVRHGIKYPIIATCRVTQVYDTGACVYFYFAFNYRGLKKNPVHIFEQIEMAARNEIIACGGSISHHHGVGKLRKKWLPETVGPLGISVLQAIKQELDPKNIFANQNLIEYVRTNQHAHMTTNKI